jgi:hypothetical protein
MLSMSDGSRLSRLVEQTVSFCRDDARLRDSVCLPVKRWHNEYQDQLHRNDG